MKLLKKINLNTILMIAIVIIAILWLRQCNRTSNLKDDLRIANMNQAALQDSVTTYRTRSGDLVFEKDALIASAKELKDLNKELADEVKDLKNNPKIVIKTVTKVVHDTTYLTNTIIKYPDGTTGLIWKHDTTFTADGFNYQKLSGESRFILTKDSIFDRGTTLFTNEFGMSFTTGLNAGKDSYEIFIKSDYPGFTATKIDGAIIDKKMIISNESPVVFGPSLGYGITFTPSGTVNHGFIIGLTATYNLNKPIKKLFRPYGL